MSESGWYHDWSPHSETTVKKLDAEESVQDLRWTGPFKTFASAKKDALRRSNWEIGAAKRQVRHLNKLRRPNG